MDSHPDWDLLALVRSCSSTTTTATATTTTPPSPYLDLSPPILPQQQEHLCFSPAPSTCSPSSVLFEFSTPLTTTSLLSRRQQLELQDICTTSTTSCSINTSNSFQSLSCNSFSSPVSSSSIIPTGRSFMEQQQQPPQQQQQQQLRRFIKPSEVTFGISSPTVTTTTITGRVTSQYQRTKKRKGLMKKVCHVPAEGLSSDMWAWRKYGQKPIKGSPHPRGYYKCSSSKGCLARKQVERNRSDPKMLIVTYTSDHNHPMPTHRNSLAGSTRQKPLTSTGSPSEQPTCSYSPSVTNLSPFTETSELRGENLNKDEENGEMGGLSDLMLSDDFYVGFEKIDGGSDESDCFSEHFSPPPEFPWIVDGTITATANGKS